MANHSVIVNEKLYSDIKDYCKLNNLKVCDIVNDLLQESFNILKYGDRPFSLEEIPVSEEPIDTPPQKVVETQKVVEVPIIKEETKTDNTEEVKVKKVIRLN